MNLQTKKRKAVKRINGDQHKQENKIGKIHRQESNCAQKIAVTGFGVRVEILEASAKETKCRRLEDGKIVIVPSAEIILTAPSTPLDQPRELFPHKIRWHDPAEI
jgi:hypothetical protein